ncbi:HTH-type transcriptional regulator Hpr [uncultured archaeon]|nr:HTH-type transcriptional regulator Hpr [uncultured archaeon]
MDPQIIQLRKSIALLQVSMNQILGKDKGKKDEISSIGISILYFSYFHKMRMSEIARIFNVSKSTATDYIDGLERRGYVRRIKGKEDMRDVFIQPTRKGSEWIKRMEQLALDYMHEGLSRLDSNEQNQFITLFSKFAGVRDDISYVETMANLMKHSPSHNDNKARILLQPNLCR